MKQTVFESDSRRLAEHPSDAREAVPVENRRLIRAQCPKCGEVALPPTGVMLAWDIHDSTGCYAFTCPECAVTYCDRAPMHVAITLVLAGASLDLRLPRISLLNGIRSPDGSSR